MMRRAQVRRALAASAFVPLLAWAADDDQVTNQNAAQSQTQNPIESQNPNSPQGQLPQPAAGSENQPPPNRTFIWLTGGLGETDNIALSPNGQSQTMVSAGVNVDLARQGPVVNGSLKGEVDYLYFLQHYFPGQFFGRLDGEAFFTLVPDRIKWVVQDDYGNAQIDALTSPNFGNLEHVNVFSTGPEFLMRPTETLYLRLGGRYQDSAWSTSPFNNQRLLGTASIGEDLSIASSVSLNADVASIRFQNPTPLNPDYTRRKFYLRYDARGVRTTLSLALGVAQANDTGAYQSKLLAQLLINRDLTPFQSVVLSAGQQYTDIADAFSALTGGAAGYTVIAPAAGASGNYLNQYASGGWQYKRGRTTVGLTGRWDRDTPTIQATQAQLDQYLSQNTLVPLDVERWTTQARVERDLTPVMTGEIHVNYLHEDYKTLGYADHTIYAGLGLTYTVNSKLQYRVRYDHGSRTALEVPVAVRVAQGFTQNSIFLTVAYRVTE